MSLKLKTQALWHLLQKYGTAWNQAWQYRGAENKTYLVHEVEFLPAALALQETPVSPAPRIAMRLMIGFAGITLLWAVMGQMDIVATAQGKVVPNGRTKTIQPFETATIKHIYVTDGQKVKAGELLVELDATVTQADKKRISEDLAIAHLHIARGKALLASLEKQKRMPLLRPQEVSDLQFYEAQRLLIGHYNEYLSKRVRIEAEAAQREAEYRSSAELVKKLEQTVLLVRRRAQDYKELLNEKFMSEHMYMEREQIRIEQEGDLANQRSKMQEMSAALREAKEQRSALTAETQRIALDSIHEGLQKVATLEQEFLKANSRNDLMKLMAPVEGTIQQLAIHTVGGVVTPAQPLMVIVPQDPLIEVEAFIENKDIGFVKAGQNAEVKIETFQYTKYGTIPAKIISVSHDAINDEKRGLIYSTRVKMNRSSLNIEGTEVNLSPGMAVTVEIKTGKRRVIEYFLNPLLQYGHESLIER